MIALHLRADLPLLLDLLGELGALDGDGGEVRQRRQQVEVFFREAADVDRRVDLHGADDVVPVPEGDAHRRTDAVDGDRLAAQEARVLERVRGHQGDLLLRHHLQDRARDRNVLLIGAFDELRQFRLRLSRIVEEDDQAALHREVLEDHVHDGVEQSDEVVALQQGFRHLHQHLEDLFACDRRLQLHARFGVSARARLVEQLGDVEAELGVEVGDPADDRPRRIVEHRVAGEVHRRQSLQFELDGAYEDFVARVDLSFRDEAPVDLDPVGGLEIDDPPAVVTRLETGMPARDRRVVENEIVPFGPPHGKLTLEVGDSWYAKVDIVDLELVHASSR